MNVQCEYCTVVFGQRHFNCFYVLDCARRRGQALTGIAAYNYLKLERNKFSTPKARVYANLERSLSKNRLSIIFNINEIALVMKILLCLSMKLKPIR